MKKILAFAAVGLLICGTTSCNQKGGSSAGGSKTIDSLSMAFGDLYGAGMGGQMRMMDSTMDMNTVLKGIEYIANADTSRAFMNGLQAGMQVLQMYQGIEQQTGRPINKSLFMKHLRDALTSGKPMDQGEMMALQGKIEPLIKKAIAESPKAIENKQKGDEYMSKLKDDKSYTFTQSGLAYKVEKQGAAGGKNFTDDDVVLVKYTGKHLDGKEFDSSKGDSVPFNLKQVVPGFAEMLKLMKPGDKVTAVIPAELAYGVEGNRGIDPNETLIFEMEAVGVQDPNAKPKPVGPRPAPGRPAPQPRR